MAYRIPESAEDLFEEHKKLCLGISKLASIIQNPGITVEDDEIAEFNDSAFRFMRSFREWWDKVLDCIHSEPTPESIQIKSEDTTVSGRNPENTSDVNGRTATHVPGGITKEFLTKLTGPELKKAVEKDMKLLQSSPVRHPSPTDTERKRKGKILVFSALSGAGKTTLINHLKMYMPELKYSVSVTTRSPRPGEKHGVDYYFTDRRSFFEMIRDDMLAEWAQVHENFYGTPRSFIDENIPEGRDVVLILDVFGKKIFDKEYSDNVGIFITTPDLATVENRLWSRGMETDDVIKLRIRNAYYEKEFAETAGRYERILVNDDLEQAKSELITLVKGLVE